MPVHRSKRSLMDIFADYSPKQMTNGQIRMECPFRENHDCCSKYFFRFASTADLLAALLHTRQEDPKCFLPCHSGCQYQISYCPLEALETLTNE